MGPVVTPKSETVDVRETPVPGELLARDGDRVERLYAAVAGDITWIFQDGVAYAIEAPASLRRRTQQTHGSLSAPMPATVVSVKVAPGDEVKGGQTLIVLEAMKMELPVRAPGDGRVTAVHCKPGDLVQPDVSLIDFA
jgi:3-methylcrotonyl-CoA carboxylase alpha subunit